MRIEKQLQAVHEKVEVAVGMRIEKQRQAVREQAEIAVAMRSEKQRQAAGMQAQLVDIHNASRIEAVGMQTAKEAEAD